MTQTMYNFRDFKLLFIGEKKRFCLVKALNGWLSKQKNMKYFLENVWNEEIVK